MKTTPHMSASVGLWARVAFIAQNVASVCFWMSAGSFSGADERFMWRPFGHGPGPVNGTGLRYSRAWVNQPPNGPGWTGAAAASLNGQ